MPAAAVIPAPIAYIKVVAVKKLVVELQFWSGWSALRCVLSQPVFLLVKRMPFTGCPVEPGHLL